MPKGVLSFLIIVLISSNVENCVVLVKLIAIEFTSVMYTPQSIILSYEFEEFQDKLIDGDRVLFELVLSNIFGNAIKYNVKKVIYISTGGAVYGEPEELPVNESCGINPISQYGISKHKNILYLNIRIVIKYFIISNRPN